METPQNLTATEPLPAAMLAPLPQASHPSDMLASTWETLLFAPAEKDDEDDEDELEDEEDDLDEEEDEEDEDDYEDDDEDDDEEDDDIVIEDDEDEEEDDDYEDDDDEDAEEDDSDSVKKLMVSTPGLSRYSQAAGPR